MTTEVSSQAGYAVLAPVGPQVSAQTAYITLASRMQQVAAQSAYLVLLDDTLSPLPVPHTRRGQVMFGSF